MKSSISVVVGISNSVLSILTANFSVRIEKKEVCMIVLNLTEMFPVNIPVLYTVVLLSPSVYYTHDFWPKNREW